MAARRNTEIRLYTSLPVSNATPYYTILRKQVYSAKGRSTRLNCYANAEITLNGKQADFPYLVEGNCMEVYARDENGTMIRLYRGYIVNLAGDTLKGRTREASQVIVSLLGIWDQRSREVIYQRYPFPDGMDVGLVFQRIASQWLQRKYPFLVIQGTAVGQSLFALDAWRRPFGSVAEDLIDATGGFAVCGGDVDPVTGYDRLFLRPFDDPASAITLMMPDPQHRLSRYQPERDATGIANVIDLKGGTTRYPNLLAEVTQGNTSFENPTAAGPDNFGELVYDGGFEGTNFPPGTPHATATITGITVVNQDYGLSHIWSSNLNDFSVHDVGRQVTITGGSGFHVGTYRIRAVFYSPNYGRLVVMLDGIVGPVGAGAGTGILSAVDAWNLTGAAAIRLTGGNWGAADTGNYMINLVNVNDSVYKPFGPDATLNVNEKFRFRARLRLENGGGTGNIAKLVVRWYDSSGTQVGADITQSFTLLTADGYDTYFVDAVCPTGAVRGRGYVVFQTKPSGATGGIMVDNLSVTSATDLVQPGWELYPTGTASVTEVDWAYEGVDADRAVHGAYSVRVKVVSSDADNNDVSFRPMDAPKIGVTPGQTKVYKVWCKNPAHQVAAGGSRPKIQLQMLMFKADGSYLGIEKLDFAATTSADWMQLVLPKNFPSDCRSVSVSHVLRGSGEALFDGAEFVDAGAGVTAATDPATYVFVEGSTYTQVIKATDVFAAGTDEYNSSATWGQITDLVDEPTITQAPDGSRYGAVRLARTATANDRPMIETVGPAWSFMPGNYLRAVGKDGASVLPVPLPILEVEWEITARGVLKMRPIVNTEEVSEARVTRDIIRQQMLLGGNSGSTGSGSYSGSASSLTVGGGGTTTPVSVPSFVTGETPIGVVDGSNAVFSLVNVPASGSVQLYMGTVATALSRVAPSEYGVSGSQITFTTAPATGTILLVDYRY